MPGDPSGVSLSPPPPGYGFIGRELACPRVPAVRELPSAPRGGAGWAPRGAEKRSLLLSFSPTPHSWAPSNQSTLLPSPSFLAPCQLLVPPPPLSRYSSWLQPGCAAPKVPPDLPACNLDHYRIQKHVDHTSARLLRYRLLVQGTRGSEERRRRASRKPFEFSDFAFCPRLLGSPSPP